MTLETVSNPHEVYDKAFKMLGKDIAIKPSTRKDKKYMVKGKFSNDKWIHFGSLLYEDYTKHKDKERRERFRIRNHKWASAPTDSPMWLSYYLLW